MESFTCPPPNAPRLGGFATVNVSNADSLALISSGNTTSNVFAGTDFTGNGSGIGLVVGQPIGPGGPTNLVDIMDVSDPTNTTNFLTQFSLPTAPYATAIASGIAFIADGSSGIQVVNYLPFDNQSQAPTLSINSNVADLDPNTDGVQILEGTTIPIQANVRDDVQVRNVELLVERRGRAETTLSFPVRPLGHRPEDHGHVEHRHRPGPAPPTPAATSPSPIP